MCRIRLTFLVLPAPQKFSSNSDLNAKKHNSQNRAPPPPDLATGLLLRLRNYLWFLDEGKRGFYLLALASRGRSFLIG